MEIDNGCELENDDYAALDTWPENPPWSAAREQALRLGIDIDAAHAQLVVLYPPDICRTMVDDGNGALIFPLLLRDSSWHYSCEHMLRLGADLAACPGWNSDSNRVTRLRDASEFEGVRFEIALLAAARRKQLRSEFSPPPDSGAKSADLAIWDGDAYVVLELKWPQISQRDANLDCLHEAAIYATIDHDHEIGPHQLILHLSSSVFSAANTQRSEKFAGTWTASIAEQLSALYALGSSILGKRHSLGQAGEAEFVRAAHGVQFAIAGPEEALTNKTGTRILRALREADEQLAHYRSDVRVAVVLISSREFDARNAKQLIESDIERDTSVLRNVDVAVIVNPPTPFREAVINATAMHSSYLKFLPLDWLKAIGDASRIAGGTL